MRLPSLELLRRPTAAGSSNLGAGAAYEPSTPRSGAPLITLLEALRGARRFLIDALDRTSDLADPDRPSLQPKEVLQVQKKLMLVE